MEENKNQQGREDQQLPRTSQKNDEQVVSANDVKAFDDDFEVREEDKIGEREIKTLDENNTSGTRRGDTFNKDANG